MPPSAELHVKLPLSAALKTLSLDESRDRISVQDLLHALGDRALAAMLFVFAMPNVLPVPPGTSAVLGAPLIFLAAQLALGLRPWLPSVISARTLSRHEFAKLVQRLGPWLDRAENLLRPRAAGLVKPPMEYVIGAVCLLLAWLVFLPVPLGNMLPALSISVLALGLSERDGVWVVAGMVLAVVSLAVVSGVLLAVFKALVFFTAQIF